MNRLFFGLYGALMTLGQPLLRRKLARRGVEEPGYLEAVEERFGHYTQPAEARSSLVWVHAVSLGETRTAALLLKALRAQHAGLRILLTHGTATGRTEGLALLEAGDIQVWQPWDSPGAVARFLGHFKPRLGLLMETEIWPTTVAAAHARGMPLVLVNGRLSEKSMQQALRMSPLSMPAYAALTSVYAQGSEDAARFRQLGARVAGTFGNLKFDAAPDAQQQKRGKAWRTSLAQPVLMFASSRDGEEETFFRQISAAGQVHAAPAAINSVAGLTPAASGTRYLVVPRHPQRFNEVEALALACGLTVSRRSGWQGSPVDSEEAMQADVWLGDSLGEMALYYGMSDAALLGGSFEPLGGQNLIEAAACGCPVVMGPHTFNFTDAADLAEAEGAALRVASMADGVDVALKLVNSPSSQKTAAVAGHAFALRNRGATAKTLAALEPLMR
jgi:3-deoxy-D-manno-octulosonic-acid transferase